MALTEEERRRLLILEAKILRDLEELQSYVLNAQMAVNRLQLQLLDTKNQLGESPIIDSPKRNFLRPTPKRLRKNGN